MPPLEGEREQHSEDEDNRDGDVGEDFEGDFLNRGDGEAESSVGESLREYYEELDENEEHGDKHGEEDTTHRDEAAEDEETPSTEDKIDKYGEDAENISRDDAGENDPIERCLDEYEKTLDSPVADSKEGVQEDDVAPLGASTDESLQESEKEAHAHDSDATDVKLDTVEHDNRGTKESREDPDSYDFKQCLAEYDEKISATEEDSSARMKDWKGTEHAGNEGLEDQTHEMSPEKSNSDAQDREIGNGPNEKQAPGSIEKSPSVNNAELSEQRTTDSVDLNSVTVHDARVMGAGELVRDWRTELGLNQYELAHKLGYDQSQISYWEINKSYVPLEDLQRLAHMAGKDLDQALSELQSRSREMGIDWKGSTYSVDMLKESVREPHATLEYNKPQQTYYLELSPMADARFRLGDRMMALLEKDGIQAIAELTAKKGEMANIRRATVERMEIELGDKLNIQVLNVRSPEDTPWRENITVTPIMTEGKMRIPFDDRFEELGLRVKDGDYARMVIQTDKGEGLVSGKIEDKSILLGRSIMNELSTKRDGEIDSVRVKTDSIIISEKAPREEVRFPIGRQGDVHIRGLLSREGFTQLQGGETLMVNVTTSERIEGEENSRRLSMMVCEPNRDIHPPYSATEQGIEMRLRTNDIVVLNREKSETLTGHERTTSHEGTSYTPIEKSMMGTRLFDALNRHIGAETLYQVEKPTQGGIDRIIDKGGHIILVEEKAEHQYGISWRTTATISQVIGYRDGFHELVEQNSNLAEKVHGREPEAIEIWTTARVPRDENGEIDLSRIQLYDPSLQRNLREGETATLRIRHIERDGAAYSDICPDVPCTVSIGENEEVIFSVHLAHIGSDENYDATTFTRIEPSTSDQVEIRVRHYDHVQATCEDNELFDEDTRKALNEMLNRVQRRIDWY